MYATNSFIGNNPFIFVKAINCRHTFTPTSESIRISISGTSRFALTNLSLDRDNVDTLISRYEVSKGYRYGFQAQEKDDEIKGKGNHYSFGNYGYDPRGVRRWNIDPVTNPTISPYAVFNNNPLRYIDIDGRRPLPVQDTYNGKSWTIASGFGRRNVKDNPKASKWHRGADINAGSGFFDYGAPILATHDGVISHVHDATDGTGGRYITVTSPDGSFQTKYLHLSKSDVIVGQQVTEGQQIGLLGASAFGSEKGTASHLHYDIEIKQGNDFVKIDPQLDSDDDANTNNSIKNLVDPQLWITGNIKVGTRDEPLKVVEIEEVTVIGYRPMKLEIRKPELLESPVNKEERTIIK